LGSPDLLFGFPKFLEFSSFWVPQNFAKNFLHFGFPKSLAKTLFLLSSPRYSHFLHFEFPTQSRCSGVHLSFELPPRIFVPGSTCFISRAISVVGIVHHRRPLSRQILDRSHADHTSQSRRQHYTHTERTWHNDALSQDTTRSHLLTFVTHFNSLHLEGSVARHLCVAIIIHAVNENNFL